MGSFHNLFPPYHLLLWWLFWKPSVLSQKQRKESYCRLKLIRSQSVTVIKYPPNWHHMLLEERCIRKIVLVCRSHQLVDHYLLFYVYILVLLCTKKGTSVVISIINCHSICVLVLVFWNNKGIIVKSWRKKILLWFFWFGSQLQKFFGRNSVMCPPFVHFIILYSIYCAMPLRYSSVILSSMGILYLLKLRVYLWSLLLLGK